MQNSMHSAPMLTLVGRSIMIVEDDYFVANELADHFRTSEAVVVGPFPTVAAARAHGRTVDLAVLDLHLRDHRVYPLADDLMDAAVPFVFYSAENMADIPRRFAHVARLPKPRPAQETVALLSHRINEVSISAMLPRLRLSARLIVPDPQAADRLVEATLVLALQEQRAMAELPPLPEWLHILMHKALGARGRDLMI